jgi:hypothetical protein
MAPRKGQTNNPAGRPKGKPNKITANLKAAISDFLNENWDQITQDWLTLEPEKRLQFYEKLIRYVVPPAADELARLTPEQLDQLIDKLKTQYQNENKIRKVS